MQAVILAAGMGSRIRDSHTLPKGFITLGEQTIIEESIYNLYACGITDILIVTGFSASHYEALAKKKQQFSTFFNPQYHCFGSLYSLYCAKQFITDDFLLLESDIIYERRAVASAMNDLHKNLIVVSGETCSGDEVYVEALDNKLIRMSKQKDQLAQDNILGEFVGINKISLQAYHFLVNELNNDQRLLEQGYYDEQGLVVITGYSDVHCLKMPDLLWSEIDNSIQFEHAKRLHPEIGRRNASVQ